MCPIPMKPMLGFNLLLSIFITISPSVTEPNDTLSKCARCSYSNRQRTLLFQLPTHFVLLLRSQAVGKVVLRSAGRRSSRERMLLEKRPDQGRSAEGRHSSSSWHVESNVRPYMTFS